MALNLAPNIGPPLDEIQWRAPPEFDQGIHNNSVLYYFAQSPFYDKTSNNEVVFQQGLNNPNMTQFLATRELFEGRLRTMSGLEFIVAHQPAETGPGAGTGVWVISKQTRRKRQGEEDEITVHATYFIVGENIYMAPTLLDILSSRVASVSSQVSNPVSTISSAESWSAAQGRTYQNPAASTTTEQSNPLLDSSLPDSSILDEAMMIHTQFGDHFMDLNPIVGRPGDFHLSSTGRKGVSLSASAAAALKKGPTLPTLNTKLGDGTGSENPLAAKPSGKETKSPKTPGGGSAMQKAKRRKGSRAGVTPQ